MSVRMDFYTVLGVKAPFNSAFIGSEEFEEHYEMHGQYIPRVIGDYMGGNYIVYGKVLFHCDDYDYETDTDIEIDPAKFEEWEAEYRRQFAESFPDWIDILPTTPFKPMTFLHYS